MQDNTTTEDLSESKSEDTSAVCDDVIKLSCNTMISTDDVHVQDDMFQAQTTSENDGKTEPVMDPQDAGSERPNDNLVDEKNINLKEGLSLGNRQQSLEEELLMEEELLKGEDDDADTNLNSDDLILDEETVMVSESSQVVESVVGSQNLNVAQHNCEQSDVSDLEINIDSLLGCTSGEPDNNLGVEMNEAELLKEDTINELTDATMKGETSDVTNKMVYDEDSLLRELEGNDNEDVVLDENIDSLLGAGDSETILDNKIDDCEENLLNNECSMPLEKDVDCQMNENSLLTGSEDSRLMLTENKAIPMESNASERVEDTNDGMLTDDATQNSETTMEDNSVVVDSQMLEDNKFTPMEDSDVDTGQSNDTPMEENALLMDENEMESDKNTMEEDEMNVVNTPMEENALLNDEENVEEKTLIEHSEITIDENNLLDEETEYNLDSETVFNENILLTDTENTNLSAAEDNVAENVGGNDVSDESDRRVGESGAVQDADKSEKHKELGNDELVDTNSEFETHQQTGLEIKINSVTSASIDEVLSESNKVEADATNETQDNDYVNENIEPYEAAGPATALDDDDSQVAIEECNELTSDDQRLESLDENSGAQTYNVIEPTSDASDFAQNADNVLQSFIEQEEISLSNDYPENETEFNENYEESVVKEEVLENEYEEDYLATKTDGDFNDGNTGTYESNADYDVDNTVVKEEMADIETLVDVKQEVLEESDHLALDHNIKHEYLDSDAIKEEYSGDEASNAYFNDEKGVHDKIDNFMDVVPVSLKRSGDFCDLKPEASDEMIVPASMIISVADIQNMQGKNMDSKGGEEIIISDKCVDVENLNDIAMDVENEGDSLLAPRSFACSICHREYQSISTLQRHEKIHNNEGGVVATIHEDISVRSEVITSLTAVEGMYSCTCGKSFKRRSSVVACMRTHRMRGIWCEHCGISFRRQRELRSHIIREHTKNSKNKKPKCTICNKEFAHQKSLVRHSKLHLKDVDLTDSSSVNELSDTDNDTAQSFNCESCNLEFMSKSELLAHKSIAHPLVLSEDSSVQKETTQQPSLKLKFSCKICKKVFLTLGSFASHKASHSKKGNKTKFRCERCQESFQTRSELSSHRRLHCRGVLHHYSAIQYIADRESIRASKQVKCDVCAQTYPSKEEMETHRDATHPFVTFSKEDATETRIFFK